MFDSSDTIDIASSCELCEGELGFGRYVEVVYGTVVVEFCSVDCAREARRARRARHWIARRRSIRRLTIGGVLLGACLTPHEGPEGRTPRSTGRAQAPRVANVAGPEVLPPGWFGPQWPPSEATLLEALGRDAWVHPLSGPFRRMPRSDSRVFGADRPGSRPIECRNGHCGVDLGGELYGEHVHAVHDGVVDYVQRGPNPDRGGRFVRLSHRNGTLFSLYFHLAAIPRGLERGTFVKAGDVIGLLGDSGVKESQPHLHFALSVRMPKDGGERYIDPEPLVALWPLRVPIDGSEVGLFTILADTGIPLGSALRKPKNDRGRGRPSHGARGAARGAATTASPASDEASSDEAPPDSTPDQTSPGPSGEE